MSIAMARRSFAVWPHVSPFARSHRKTSGLATPPNSLFLNDFLTPGLLYLPLAAFFRPRDTIRIPRHESDPDRAAQGLSRAASAAVAGVADAGVRARHRARRGYHGRHPGAGAIAQGRTRSRRGRKAAHGRSGAAVIPSARAVSGRRQ